MAETKPKIALKLFIHKENQQVVFAEVRKNFVDFIFSLLTLPLGTVTQIITQNNMVGGIGAIYQSVEGLEENYFILNKQTKEILLKPSTTQATARKISPLVVPSQTKNIFYGCVSDHACIAEDCRARCKYGYCAISKLIEIVSYTLPDGEQGGYVKDEVAYMVTDDLAVEPLTATSIVNLLKINGIKNVAFLEENVVHLDMDMGLKLLKASLQSKAILTSVFLSDMKA